MPGLVIPPRWQTNPAEAGKVAVLCRDEYYVFEHPRPSSAGGPLAFDGNLSVIAPEISLCGLLISALAAGIETLFLLPAEGGTQFNTAADHPMLSDWPACALPEALTYESAGELTVHPLSVRSFGLSALGGIVAQFASGGPLLCVYGPEALDGWGLLTPAIRGEGDVALIPWYRARVLASAWLAAAHVLGQRLRFSASYSGLSLMRQCLASQEKRLDLAPPNDDYRTLIREAQAHPLSWARPYVTDAQAVRVVSYDRNFSWITAAREVPFGNPEPVSSVVENTPGVYFVALTPPPVLPLDELPGPVCEGGRWVHETRGAWAWEPTLRFARRWGYHIEVLTGYAWPRTQRVDLRPWQDRVWAARREMVALAAAHTFLANHIGQAGEQLVKAVARAAIGRLNQTRGYEMQSLTNADPATLRHLDIGDHGELTGMGEVEAPLGRSDLVRPEWWSTIVSQANERLLQVVFEYSVGFGAIGAYFDGVYLLHEAPELDGPPLKAGGWHKEHDVMVAADVLRTGNAGRLVAACNRAPAYVADVAD